MKVASRFMPKYEIENTSSVKHIIALIICFFVTAFYVPYLFALVLFFAFVAVVWGLYSKPKNDKYFQDLFESRSQLSICDFAKEFDCRIVDTWIIRATYDQIQHALCTEMKIPIKSSDSLFETLQLDDEDIEYIVVEEVAKRAGRSFDNTESNPYYGKVKTVKDLVLFLNHQPTLQAT
ncbi:hypothetical protein [Vibrio fluvialis]|uniref:hypothetical protein n=1 Tax=Vibrio fluvialis TaxID=676 RepID=UPI001F273801|nr:hypothetical protein [Vibrio fluvialis]MCE7652773.1 hypothetical protein [Vibrio fluvialis]